MTLPMLIYVAGPYSSDPPANTRYALLEGERLRNLVGGKYPLAPVVVYVPHMSIIADMITPRLYDYWLRDCIRLIDLLPSDRCLLWRMGGESKGADTEVNRATLRKWTVMYEAETPDSDVFAWVRERL